MAKLEDYGIRIINHGEWSDPEVEWKKYDFQTVLFNYWDVAECTDFETLDLNDEIDLRELVSQLWELTPSEFSTPQIHYEWEVGSSYDDYDYYKDEKLSPKKDFVLHTASQALRQAMKYCDDNGIVNTDIQIFRRAFGIKSLEYDYSLQGSTLKDCTSYKKCA